MTVIPLWDSFLKGERRGGKQIRGNANCQDVKYSIVHNIVLTTDGARGVGGLPRGSPCEFYKHLITMSDVRYSVLIVNEKCNSVQWQGEKNWAEENAGHTR